MVSQYGGSNGVIIGVGLGLATGQQPAARQIQVSYATSESDQLDNNHHHLPHHDDFCPVSSEASHNELARRYDLVLLSIRVSNVTF